MDELSEAELRYYNDLFKICSESSDSSGKIPALKATSLFRSANLSNEIINKITSLVGIPQTALHLSRQQFYGCLKLIAAYQASVPLREEILTTTVNLPLPQFSWIDSPTTAVGSSSAAGMGPSQVGTSAMVERNGYSGGLKSNRYDLIELASTVDSKSSLGSINANVTASSSSSRECVDHISTSGEMTNSDQPSTDSEVDHNDDPVTMLRSAERHHIVKVRGHGGGKLVEGGIGVGNNSSGSGVRVGGMSGSPEAWSTASDSPTPTNSVAERPWANQSIWPGLVCEEQRQLLGTEEESSDKHSSDDDQDVDLDYFYQISQTQKEYYLKQFRTIQPDVHGLVSGQVARVFFEKSRIPIEELRHIWQMCDVTRDGALNLAEFTAAMHLVVLRRNNIPIPAALPPCLMPSLLQHSLFPAPAGASTTDGLLQKQLSGGSSSRAVSGGSVAASDLGSSISKADRSGMLEEADLLHLESDDNTDDNSVRSAIDSSKKDYQRMINHPAVAEPLKFAHPHSHSSIPGSGSSHGSGGVAAGTTKLIAVEEPDSPPKQLVGSSKLVDIASGRKTPTNLSTPPLHHQQQQQQQQQQTKSTKYTNENSITPPNTLGNKDWNTSTSKEWTKFTESPTSNVSSPGPKPVNFDMQRTTQAIVSDPQILHPVPLRVTPVGAEAADNSNLVFSDITVGTGGILIVQRDETSPKQQQQQQQQAQSHQSTLPPSQHVLNQRDSLTSSDLRAIQRPQPKKPPSKSLGAIPPPPQREPSITTAPTMLTTSTTSTSAGQHQHPGMDTTVMASSLDAATLNSVINNSSSSSSSSSSSAANVSTTISSSSGGKKDLQAPPPPLPPPRPPMQHHRHTRSSSLDLNKLKLNTHPNGISATVAATALPKQLEDQLKMPPPPEVPPRITPTQVEGQHQVVTHHQGFADFAHFPGGNSSSGSATRMVSAENNVTTIHLDASGNMTATGASGHGQAARGGSTLVTGAGPAAPVASGGAVPLQTVASRNSAFEVYRKPPAPLHHSQHHAHPHQQPPLQSRSSQSPSQPAPPPPHPLVASRSVESTGGVSSIDYEKRIAAVSEGLRQVRFKTTAATAGVPDMGSGSGNAPDVLKHLKEQNLLLLRICNDLSEELLQTQQKREDIRLKIELQEQNLGASAATAAVAPSGERLSASHHP